MGVLCDLAVELSKCIQRKTFQAKGWVQKVNFHFPQKEEDTALAGPFRIAKN